MKAMEIKKLNYLRNTKTFIRSFLQGFATETVVLAVVSAAKNKPLAVNKKYIHNLVAGTAIYACIGVGFDIATSKIMSKLEMEDLDKLDAEDDNVVHAELAVGDQDNSLKGDTTWTE